LAYTQPMSNDRRKMPRAALTGILFNKYIDGFPFMGELLDLSETGARVRRIHEPDPVRASYPVEIELPGIPERLWLWARTVRTDDKEQALRFVAVDAASKTSLAAIVEHLAGPRVCD
jgi:PilZ domain